MVSPAHGSLNWSSLSKRFQGLKFRGLRPLIIPFARWALYYIDINRTPTGLHFLCAMLLFLARLDTLPFS